MFKWIIFSDNYKEIGILYYIYELYKDVDKFLYLGDFEFSYNDIEFSLYQCVKGNCDFYLEFLEEEIIEENGICVFYIYGYFY